MNGRGVRLSQTNGCGDRLSQMIGRCGRLSQMIGRCGRLSQMIKQGLIDCRDVIRSIHFINISGGSNDLER